MTDSAASVKRIKDMVSLLDQKVDNLAFNRLALLPPIII
jgi:hypothetical protein